MSTDKMHVDNNLSLRLTTARNFKKMDQKVAAQKIGISPVTLNRYEKNRREAPLQTVNLLADLYGVRSAWLLTGEGPMVKNIPEEPATSMGWMPSPRREQRKVPVISWVQAGAWSETEDPFQPGYAEEFVLILENCGPNTFALRVVGDSMEPEFVAGDILLVDPACDWSSRDYIIAKNGDDEATFKQIVTDGGKIFLNPLNRRYPIQDMTGKNFKVIGRVIQKVKKY